MFSPSSTITTTNRDTATSGDKPSRQNLSGRLKAPIRYLLAELSENLKSSKHVESLWLMGRTVVALVGIFAAAFLVNGTTSAHVIYAGVVVVLTTNLFLLYLLRQGKTCVVAVIGLLLDNLVIMGVWAASLGLAGDTRPPNDLYIALFPVLSLWASRLGFKLGIPYTLIWMAWFTWPVYTFMPAGSYEVEQLPVRIAFLTLSSVLGMWTARLLKSQTKIAQESELRASTLQELDAAKDRFIATVSHELKTPMASILGFTRLLRANAENDVQLERLDIIERNGRRLNVLIDDLLAISQIQNSTLSMALDSIEVNEFVTETVDDLKPVLTQRAQAVYVRVPGNQMWIKGDVTRLAQVLTNLITNASKYSPSGSEIRIRLKVESGSLSISVSDDGDGIDIEDQKSLFQPFYRTKAAQNSNVPGTGLGLFISRRIMELHGGELTLESEPGRGTTVEMRLKGVSSVRPANTKVRKSFANAFEALDEAA